MNEQLTNDLLTQAQIDHYVARAHRLRALAFRRALARGAGAFANLARGISRQLASQPVSLQSRSGLRPKPA